MANPVAGGPAQVTALQALQSRFCLIDLSGEIRIADRDQIKDILSGSRTSDVSFYKKGDGDTLMRRHLEALAFPDKPQVVIAQFWMNPGTHVYTAIAFSPKPMPGDALNYWSGPTVQPCAGDWSRIRDFIRDVICDGDVLVFGYLLKYLAHMLQKPEEKPGVMIVMLGGQGTGKGTFFAILRAIWSRTTLQVSDVDEVIGQFNAALERNYVICMDEALFSGDKKSMERLKSLITEPVCRTEQKHQPARSINSYHRFFAASNNDHFAQIDRDDRRFVFLRVTDRRQGDSRYWSSLYAAIAHTTVIGAMVSELLAMNVAGFDVRQRPRTKEHLNQKLQSLSGFDRFWFEVLQEGTFSLRQSHVVGVETWSSPRFIATQTLLAGLREFDKSAERHRPVQAKQVAQSLARLCPSAATTRQKEKHGEQSRGYDLPTLTAARGEFERVVGGRVDWGERREPIGDPDVLEALWEAYELSGTYDGD